MRELQAELTKRMTSFKVRVCEILDPLVKDFLTNHVISIQGYPASHVTHFSTSIDHVMHFQGHPSDHALSKSQGALERFLVADLAPR